MFCYITIDTQERHIYIWHVWSNHNTGQVIPEDSRIPEGLLYTMTVMASTSFAWKVLEAPKQKLIVFSSQFPFIEVPNSYSYTL
jgi:hypothetical protein